MFGCSGGNRIGLGGRDVGISGGLVGEVDIISGVGSIGGVGLGVGGVESLGFGGGRIGIGFRGVRGLFIIIIVRFFCLGIGCSIL